MRIRTVKPEFWTDEKTGQMKPESALVFLALLNFADDKGRLRGDVRLIRGQLFPYRPKLDVEAAIEDCLSLGLLQQYEVRGQVYFLVVNFNKHQRINRPTPSLLPEPPDPIIDDSLSAHTQLTDDSMKTHTQLTEDSPWEGKGKEGKGKGKERKHTSKAEIEIFKTIWNSKADSTFARLSVLTEARVKAIERFLKAHKLEDFEAGIEKANKSSFLKGQGNTGFKASFDWILKSDNFVKLIEGNYDDRSNVTQPPKKPSITLTQEQIRKQYEPVDTATYSPELKLQFGIPLTEKDKEHLQKMQITVR